MKLPTRGDAGLGHAGEHRALAAEQSKHIVYSKETTPGPQTQKVDGDSVNYNANGPQVLRRSVKSSRSSSTASVKFLQIPPAPSIKRPRSDHVKDRQLKLKVHSTHPLRPAPEPAEEQDRTHL